MYQPGLLSAEKAYATMSDLGKDKIPFLFIIDFECLSPIVLPLNEAANHGLFYNLRGISNNGLHPAEIKPPLQFFKDPVDFNTYSQSFDKAQSEIRFGNSYLLNLTFPTPIRINRSLKEIFNLSIAPYKLLFRDEFTVFSPECFVRINKDGVISSFPMKGTIDASIPGAAKQLLSDPKELAEHNTIVDLIRNDLSMVAKKVRVNRFRYLEEIRTNQKHLLQASSDITGKLSDNWRPAIGDIMQKLLPAGSISGAPKNSTLKIIKEAEPIKRGYYTGVFGIFDGESLDSAVMIRFIEQQAGQMIFRSGGGITINSNADSEYQEMIDKVYVPFI